MLVPGRIAVIPELPMMSVT